MQARRDISKNNESTDKSIEEIVDIILHKKKSEKYDFNKFSMKNKQGESLYFVRKKKKNKDNVLSDEIIHEARDNLGLKKERKKHKNKRKKKKPEEKKDDANKPDHDKIASMIDKKFDEKIDTKQDFDSKDKIDELLIQPEINKKQVEEKNLKTDESDNEKILDNLISENITEEKKKNKKKSFFRRKKEQKRKEKIEHGKNKTINNIDDFDKKIIDDKKPEDKALKLAQEHNFFNDTKINKEEKINDKFSFDKPSDHEFSDSGDEKFLNDLIKKSPDEKYEEKKPDEKAKKGLFKKDKKEKIEEKKIPEENVTDAYDSAFKFHVANIPTAENIDDEESNLVDKKIVEKSSEDKKDKTPDIAKEKAFKLAEKHIKTEENRKSNQTLIKNIMKDKTEKEEIPRDIDEHSFFDDYDDFEDGAGGWTPQITEQDKKKIGIQPTGSPELETPEIELPREALQTKSITLKELGFSESEWEELDFYALQEPFAYVEILREKETLDKRYFLVEASLSNEEQETLNFILETLDTMNVNPNRIENDGDDKYLLKIIEEIIDDYSIKISDSSKSKVLYYLKNKALGLEKIDPVMMDPNIEDISCDGSNTPLFLYHRKYGSLKSNIEFKSEEELSAFVYKLAQKCGKHISIAEPMLDATMPDGSRIQMTLSTEVSARGSTFTIRKFREDPFSPPDLIEFNTMSAEMVAYLWLAVENGINTLIAGGTASGKTTALNAISLFIPRESKIVTIEETREINLPHPNWIPGVARSGFGEVVSNKMIGEIDLYDLMKAALRQRPEYILVGEIRGREAYVLFQAMATGHATYSTVHADSAQSLIHRLEGKPINIPRVMLQSLDIVTLHVITRVKNKRARRCKQIIEIIDIDPTTKEILTNEVFRWEPVDDSFIYSGKSYVLESIRAEKDLSREQMTNELKNRTKIIDWMNTNNIREFRKVATVVSQYVESPDEVMKKIK